MRVERLDGAEREQRAEAEGDVRRAPDFRAGGVDRKRQSLAAKRLRARHRVPSRRRPALIGIRPARRCGDDAVVELDAVLIADAIERRQHVTGEFARFLQNGGGDVAVEIAVMPGLDGGLQPRTVVEGEQDVGDRSGVGHKGYSGSGLGGDTLPYHETTRVSMGGWLRHGRIRRRIPRVSATRAGAASSAGCAMLPLRCSLYNGSGLAERCKSSNRPVELAGPPL